VTYDGCIRKHERSENFHTMNERVARELIRAFQQKQRETIGIVFVVCFISASFFSSIHLSCGFQEKVWTSLKSLACPRREIVSGPDIRTQHPISALLTVPTA